VRLFFGGDLLGKAAQIGGGQVQVQRGFGRLPLQHAKLARERHAQAGIHLGFQLAVALGLGGLPLERIHLPGDLFQNVEDARQVLLGAFQLGFRQPLAGLVLGDAGGLFDDGAAVLRLGAEDLADAALLDDGVALRAQAGAHEDILDVAQAGGVAVDQVFALAGAVEAAGDGDLAVLALVGGDGDRGADARARFRQWRRRHRALPGRAWDRPGSW
jgi:hypothetical protein